MPKVLIITYYWPPAGGAGVQRWLKFVKYLRQFNWEPVVYTALDGEMPVVDKSLEKDVPPGTTVLKKEIWEPYTVYKRFIGRKKDDRINASFLSENKKPGLAEKISVWIRGNFFIPDARRFWIKPSISYLNEYLAKEKINVVISSGPPHSMHMIALGLKKKNPGLKWIADFRDPWTHIDFYDKLMLTRKADRAHHRMEAEVLKEADVVLSIGSAMNEEFQTMYREAGGKKPEKFIVITNGFDEDDIRPQITRDQKFSIAHIGTLVRDRNPDILWKVLKDLVNENPQFENELEIKLVGKVDIFVMEQLAAQGLMQYVRKVDYLPHDEVIKEQQRSRLLLLLVNNTKNAKGILTGKFFEYMASGSPILAIGPVDGDLAEILRETASGSISGFSDYESLKQNILRYYDGDVQTTNRSAVSNYSRRALTGKLADVLNSLT